MKVLPVVVWEPNTDSGSPPAQQPAQQAAQQAQPPAPDLPAGEMSADALATFVGLAEEGGWVDKDPSGAGNANIPDVPATTTATPVTAPSATPSSPPVSVPAQTAPAQSPPAQKVTPPVPQGQSTEPVVQAPPVQPTPQVASTPPQQQQQQQQQGQQAGQGQPQQGQPAQPTQAQPAALGDPFHQFSEELGKHAEAFVTALAEKDYQITPEAHEAFIGGDTKGLSQLCAKIHFNAVNSVLNSISKLMPVMVDGLLQQRREQDDRESRFWDANAHLKRSEHRDLVRQVMHTYNQLNPNVNEAKRFKDVGLLVAQMHGIPLTVQAPSAAPQQQVVQTPGRVVRQVEAPGFAPASAGGSPAANGGPSSGPGGAWDGFVDFALAQERGLLDQ